MIDGASVPILERTLLCLIAFELWKRGLGVSRALGLPFPVHGSFMGPFGLSIAEHNELVLVMTSKRV